MKGNEILVFLQGHRHELAAMGVVKIGLFGSYARDEAREDSDIDIAIELSGPHKADSYFKLLHFLEDSLRRKIDLGIESALKPAVRDRIAREIIYV